MFALYDFPQINAFVSINNLKKLVFLSWLMRNTRRSCEPFFVTKFHSKNAQHCNSARSEKAATGGMLLDNSVQTTLTLVCCVGTISFFDQHSSNCMEK